MRAVRLLEELDLIVRERDVERGKASSRGS
jgi:hypothetical protein